MKRRLAIVAVVVLASTSLANAQAVVPAGTFVDKPGDVNFVCGDPGCAVFRNPGKVEQGFITNAAGAQIGPRLLLGVANHGNNTTVSDNGAGTYFVGAGADAGPNPSPFALWNVAYFIGSFNQRNYDFRIYVDFNPLAGTTLAQHGYQNLSCASNCSVQSGQFNAGLAELATSGGDYFAPPTLFSPFVQGEYTFAIVAYEKAGANVLQYTNEVTRVAVQVNVVPEPSTAALLGLALALTGTAAHRRATRRRNLAA